MGVRATYTRYEVPGWGVGELWTTEDAVLDHELAFTPSAGAGADPGEGAARGRGAVPGAITGADLDAARAAPHEGAESPPTGTVPPSSSRMVDAFAPNAHAATAHVDPGALVERFAAFLGGVPVFFGDVPLDLDWCTPFQHAVATSLRAVARGEVVSYAELAALAGYPGAQRAVGTFCARNRFALLIPCHRVVAADGIGGYGSAGAAVKRRLLALEGVVL
jgi:O-6-methylguanine DNA methyltransferase